ncbi:hypothetical protein ACH3XW_9245 [Acanthocheilonema viteae]
MKRKPRFCDYEILRHIILDKCLLPVAFETFYPVFDSLTSRNDDQMRSERLSNQTEKLMRSDFLRIAYGNSLLRASLILLTIAMIFFTVMKICKLFYEIRNHQRQQQVSESDNETPHILVEAHSADYPFFGNKKWNKNGKCGRTFHLWKTKSDSDSNSLPSKDMKVNISLSNKWDSKRDNSQNIYPISKSSLKSLTKGVEMTSSDTIKTATYSGGHSTQTGNVQSDNSDSK